MKMRCCARVVDEMQQVGVSLPDLWGSWHPYPLLPITCLTDNESLGDDCVLLLAGGGFFTRSLLFSHCFPVTAA